MFACCSLLPFPVLAGCLGTFPNCNALKRIWLFCSERTLLKLQCVCNSSSVFLGAGSLLSGLMLFSWHQLVICIITTLRFQYWQPLRGWKATGVGGFALLVNGQWYRNSQATNFLLMSLYSLRLRNKEDLEYLLRFFLASQGPESPRILLLGIILTFLLVFIELSRPCLCKIHTLGLDANFCALPQFKEGSVRQEFPQPELLQDPSPVCP